MARTANVFARVEPEVKEQAEQVLDRLGIPMSNAVGMFLRQIVLQRGIPFEMKLPAYEEPVAYGSLTKEQFNAEISAKYFQIYFRGTVSSRECCRTDRTDYDRNSEAGYYAEQKPAL